MNLATQLKRSGKHRLGKRLNGIYLLEQKKLYIEIEGCSTLTISTSQLYKDLFVRVEKEERDAQAVLIEEDLIDQPLNRLWCSTHIENSLQLTNSNLILIGIGTTIPNLLVMVDGQGLYKHRITINTEGI